MPEDGGETEDEENRLDGGEEHDLRRAHHPKAIPARHSPNVLSGVIVALVSGALPAIQHFGLGFVVADVWNPVTERFGAVARRVARL